MVVDGTGRFREPLEMAAAERSAVVDSKLAAAQAAQDGPADDEDRTGFGNMDSLDRYALTFYPEKSLTAEQRLEFGNKIREGELYALVEIPTDLMQASQEDPPVARFVSNDAVLSDARRWLADVLQRVVRQDRLRELGLDPLVVAQTEGPVPLEPTRPYERAADGSIAPNSPQESMTAIFLPFGLMMLMFMVIFLAAQPMMESALEEKSQRISEVLLGSVSPTQLMAGKLIGNVAASLVIFAIYGLGGFFLLKRWDLLSLLPPSLMAWFLAFQLAAVLLFSSVFLVIGASVSQLKEAQSLLMPIWMMMVAPLMVWFFALRDPNGILATVFSFFPPSAPMMIILRLATGAAVPWWQPWLALALLLVTTAIVVWLAGNIYRASLLRGDTARNFIQLLSRARAA